MKGKPFSHTFPTSFKSQLSFQTSPQWQPTSRSCCLEYYRWWSPPPISCSQRRLVRPHIVNIALSDLHQPMTFLMTSWEHLILPITRIAVLKCLSISWTLSDRMWRCRETMILNTLWRRTSVVALENAISLWRIESRIIYIL